MKHNLFFAGIISSLLTGILFSCQSNGEPKGLPRLGNHIIEGSDTLYHTIPDFEFVNQDSILVTNRTFENKLYVADFFFTSCPTICPKMTQQMLRIHHYFIDNPDLKLISHSIDTKYDTIPRLKAYATNLGVTSDKWHFVTGEKSELFAMADAYFNIIIEDETLPGGYDHSGRLILVDHNKHVRSFCNGTDEKQVDAFIKDIETLLSDSKP